MVSLGGAGKVHNNERFQMFAYKLRGYPEASRNPDEDPERWRPSESRPGQLTRRKTNPLDRIEERVLGSSMLCTVDGDEFRINVKTVSNSFTLLIPQQANSNQ
jgi:hypothetical protein